FHSFARWFIHWLVVSKLEKAMANFSATVEIMMNASIDAIRAQQLEVDNLSKISTQNRLALDLLYAKEGGVRVVINVSCCSYVNQDKWVETDLQ
ncbi:ERVV2 protein, partial [Indicator maculatus]|nr:ERVV2 protein [Indicator maculatus]